MKTRRSNDYDDDVLFVGASDGKPMEISPKRSRFSDNNKQSSNDQKVARMKSRPTIDALMKDMPRLWLRPTQRNVKISQELGQKWRQMYDREKAECGILKVEKVRYRAQFNVTVDHEKYDAAWNKYNPLAAGESESNETQSESRAAHHFVAVRAPDTVGDGALPDHEGVCFETTTRLPPEDGQRIPPMDARVDSAIPLDTMFGGQPQTNPSFHPCTLFGVVQLIGIGVAMKASVAQAMPALSFSHGQPQSENGPLPSISSLQLHPDDRDFFGPLLSKSQNNGFSRIFDGHRWQAPSVVGNLQPNVMRPPVQEVGLVLDDDTEADVELLMKLSQST